ncbi:hypothetical protein K7711_24655 [Nocardia sp. CA2R105]|uniref:hypothetical protein n=1 Tax=Nocardia coffeae TaxID=2873381 RepID=UPI001CA6DC45|nr:hypothetical protein [Nocardia coffeae]MBY8859680.1 hypothetical protein [Nocardia coffeae]
MLHYTRTGDTIVIPSRVREHAGPDLAHDRTQRHLNYRINRRPARKSHGQGDAR